MNYTHHLTRTTWRYSSRDSIQLLHTRSAMIATTAPPPVRPQPHLQPARSPTAWPPHHTLHTPHRAYTTILHQHSYRPHASTPPHRQHHHNNTTPLLTTPKPPHHSPHTTQYRSINLGAKVRKLRGMGFRGTDTDQYFDPYAVKPRDLTLGQSATEMITAQAMKQREKQLEAIRKLNQKTLATEKAAELRRKGEKERKVPLKERLTTWAATTKVYIKEAPMRLKERRAQLIKQQDKLSILQRLFYIYPLHTLCAITALLLGISYIPPVRGAINDLTRLNTRRRAGVLGLDEYCTPEKCGAELIYVSTGDFSFDVRYLQKMGLRDLFVMSNAAEEVLGLIRTRRALLKEVCEALAFFDEQQTLADAPPQHDAVMDDHQPPPRPALTPEQREAAMLYGQVLEPFGKEEEDLDVTEATIKDNWQPTFQDLRAQLDVKLDGLLVRFLQNDNARQRTLKKVEDMTKGLANWKQLMHDERLKMIERNHQLTELRYELLREKRDYEQKLEEMILEAEHHKLWSVSAQNNNNKNKSGDAANTSYITPQVDEMTQRAIEQFKAAKQKVD